MSAGSAYWWDQLPEDFYKSPDGTELDKQHRFKVGATAAADRVLRAGLGSVMGASMTPLLLSKKALSQEFERLAFYREFAEKGDVQATFQAPEPVRMRVSNPRVGHYRPFGIPAQDLSFDSPFVPLNPAMRERFAGFRRNQVAHAQYWRHPRGPRRTLIFVHGVIEGWYGLNAMWFALKWFYRRGYDVVQFTLPFHGYRTERRHGASGIGFFSGGFSHINEAMLQGVCDLRVLLDYLYAQGAPSVGVSGLSLGGYFTSMLATADPRLAFAIPNSPVVAPIDMVLDWEPTGALLRAVMKRSGMSVRELRRDLAVHSPLTYAPQLDGDRALIIGGAGDRLTSPRFVRLLHDHWRESHLHWFPGNHVIHLSQGAYLRRMKNFMDRHTASPML